MQHTYLCIDLKSFYASVECVERGLDPLSTNLVVADPERTKTTICLAVSPSMKALGVPNRCRVFEIPDSISYIMAAPRMQLYIDYSAEIYGIYLKYISQEDIHVYSIDEAFMDVTEYLHLYRKTPREVAVMIMEDIYNQTGITATAGIGTNLYLTKIALDITAKHVPDHIGYLDEETYRRTLWDHMPLTDFWKVGSGTQRRLARCGIRTMREIAEADETVLYRIFGIDAELLIDHAWGREKTTIGDIKKYVPRSNSLSNGQVLPRDYEHEEGKLVVKEMADQLSLQMIEKHLITESLTLHMSYNRNYFCASAHGTVRFLQATNAASIILPEVERLYEEIKHPHVPLRRICLTCNRVVPETYQQLDLFHDQEDLNRERRLREAMIEIRNRYGKNAILRGMNLESGGTMRERNQQIGGHRSGNTRRSYIKI